MRKKLVKASATLSDWVKSKNLNNKLLAIEWVDTFGCPEGWQFESEIVPKITTVISVGFLFKETDDFFFIVPHISTAENAKQFAGHLSVPKKQVVDIVLVE